MYPWGDFLPISTPLSSHLPFPLNSYFLYTLPSLYSYLPSLKHLSIKSHTVSPSVFAYFVTGLLVSGLYFAITYRLRKEIRIFPAYPRLSDKPRKIFRICTLYLVILATVQSPPSTSDSHVDKVRSYLPPLYASVGDRRIASAPCRPSLPA